MSWLIVILGALLALGGGASLLYGFDIVVTERGSAMVIAGTTALAGGAVTLAIGLALRALAAAERRLIARLPVRAERPRLPVRSEAPAETAPRSAEPWQDLTAARRNTEAAPSAGAARMGAAAGAGAALAGGMLVGSALATRTEDGPVTAPISAPDASTPARPAAPAEPLFDPAFEAVLHERLDDAADSPRRTFSEAAATLDAEAILADLLPPAAAEAAPAPPAVDVPRLAEPAPPAPAIARDLQERQVQERHAQNTDLHNAEAQDADAADRVTDLDAATAAVAGSADDAGRDWAAPDDLFSDPPFAGPEPSGATATPETEAGSPIAVSAGPVHADAEPHADPVSEGAEDPHDLPAPPSVPQVETPPTAAPSRAERAVLGVYRAAGRTYTMFADGSVEAVTETGVEYFDSLDQLRAHMSAEAQG